jgi:hypothetical protein
MYTTTYGTVHPTGLAIGTVGAQPLFFATNNLERVRITNQGNVGIGSSTPWAKLSVASMNATSIVPLFAIGTSSTGTATSTLFRVDGSGDVTITNGGYTGGSPTLTLNDTTSSVIPKFAFQQGGTTKGQIEGGVGLTSSMFFDIGTTRFMSVGYGGYTVQIGRNFSGTALSSLPPNDGLLVEGSVGIGTTTPMWALTIASTTGSQLSLSAGAGIAQWTFRNAGGNLYLSTTTVSGTATSTMPALTILNNGKLGIGTSSPLANFTLVASSSNAFRIDDGTGGNVLSVDSTITSNNAGIDITAGGGQTGNLLNFFSSGGTPLAFFTAAGGFQQNISSSTALRIQDGMSNDVFVVNSTSGNIGIGTTTPYARLAIVDSTTALRDELLIATTTGGIVFRVDSYGRTYGDGAYSSPAADYAEYFYTNSKALQSGEVVCVDVLQNNAVKRCERGADNDVMGIVSTKPSVIGNFTKESQKNASHYAIIGMLGQVDAYVSDENGPIRVGDSLTSASTSPGYAMRADAGESTVGIALESFTPDSTASSTVNKGKIKVLISRRNKSLAVEQIEAMVVERVANMKIEDQVSQMVKDATSNVSLEHLSIDGSVSAGAYETAQESVTSFTLGSSTVTGTIPSTVLTASSTVDLYKLATYNLSGITALAAAIDAQNLRITSLEARVSALESGAVSVATGSPFDLSTSTLSSAFGAVGALIKNGLAQFGTLVADQFVAATNSAGTSSAGTVNILAGNTVAQVNNAYVASSTKVFVTFNSPLSGNWYVSNKQPGSFRVILSAPQTSDVSFDYFLVQTEGQATTTTATSTDRGPSVILGNNLTLPTIVTPPPPAPATPPGTSTPIIDTAAPLVSLLGDAAMQVTIGDTFVDPGAIASDAVDGDLTPHIVVTGTVDTATAGLYTLTYSATDAAGNTGTTSRTVSVVAAPPPPSEGTPTP